MKEIEIKTDKKSEQKEGKEGESEKKEESEKKDASPAEEKAKEIAPPTRLVPGEPPAPDVASE